MELLTENISLEDFTNGVITKFKLPKEVRELKDPRDLIMVVIRCLYELRTSISEEMFTKQVIVWVTKVASSYYYTAPEALFELWEATAIWLDTLTKNVPKGVNNKSRDLFRDYRVPV
jgi:hypothetical protein